MESKSIPYCAHRKAFWFIVVVLAALLLHCIYQAASDCIFVLKATMPAVHANNPGGVSLQNYLKEVGLLSYIGKMPASAKSYLLLSGLNCAIFSALDVLLVYWSYASWKVKCLFNP